MNIFSCVDNANIEKIFVLFYSCFINCSRKEELKFFIITEDKIDDNFKIPVVFRDNLKIRNIDNNFIQNSEWDLLIKEFSNHFYIQGSKCNHIMNFSRFFFFKIFPEVDRAIYLDWDMIVEEDICKLSEFYDTSKLVVATSSKPSFDSICGNIANLNQTDFNIVSVDNYYNPYIFKINSRFRKNEIFKKYNIILKDITGLDSVASKKSFNAGFYITSKEIFEEEKLIDLIKKLLTYQKNTKVFRFGTQVIMNLISIDNILFVDKKWNNSPSEGNYITHWNGSKIPKPWDSNHPLWIKYLTEFKKSVKEII
tara:strand:- start:2240 stop:3169 length:930 start_codon:yes stop_codon:yes gene_type:complete